MKPDGVATEPMDTDGMETEGTEPVTEPTSSEGASQNGTTPSPPQPDQPQNAVEAKSKSKDPVKGKTTAAGPATTGPGTRPKATQSRVANGLTKTASSTTTKKPIPATTTAAEKKKPTSNVGHSGPIKKPIGSSTAVATSRAQPKVTTVGSSRSATTAAAIGTKTGTAVSTATGLSRRPATSVGTKPKTTAPAPRPAPAAKPSTSATAKTTAVPKTNRATGSSASRSAAISATGRTVTGTTTTSTVTRTSRTASQQPVKPLVTASAARKDVGTTSTTAPAKRTVTSTVSRPASNKPSNSEAPKPAAATKRPPPSIKAPQPKPDDKKSVPTRKVPPSPRNTPSRPASGKNAAASSSHRQAGSVVGVKLQPSKPTQSVLPLVVKGKTESAAKPDDKEPVAESVQLSAAAVAIVAAATAAAIAREESVPGPEVNPTVESSLDVPTSYLDVQENVDVQVPNVTSQSVLDTSETKQEALIETSPVEVTCPTSSAIDQDSEENASGKIEEKLNMAVPPIAQEATEQETMTASPVNISVATIVSSCLEEAQKAEPNNSDCYEDVEEEEREGSQQVSLSEMSGTQPTEESRPGSAGLAGSVWRAGALLSELDSEDVSCSQQGASELSAPGVLEGMESMDDLGDASLKGADGEGASVGSPDFEKVSDILANEDDDDDDDDDRVCDMEVGSERAEDSHRQQHGNEDDEEDEDVEMASEGITESGLESYGNADEDDLTEDYRLDNLNRIQHPPMVPSAPLATHWNQPSCFADTWAQPPQPASTLLSSPSSEYWQGDPETPTQTPAQARSDVSSSSPLPTNLFEPPTCSPQQAPLTAAEGDVSPKPGMTPSQTCKFQPGTSSDPGLASDSNQDTSIPEKVDDCINFSGTETQSKGELQLEPLSPVPPVLPDIMQDLGIHLQHADEEEEPETLPADDVLGGPATAPSSPSSATEDEASDTEGEMQISGQQAELHGTGNAYGTAPVGHSVSSLEEREEMSGENETGGGSETPQSATSAASYGFDYTTSNSNAQSSAESCSKSPGIFSLENEEQLPDEAKDPSLIKELILMPATASGEKIDRSKSQHGEFQAHPEQHYMLCGESSELPEPGSVPLESGLPDPSSAQHLQEEQDLDTQHPYYSTICEKTDSPLAEEEKQDLTPSIFWISPSIKKGPSAFRHNQMTCFPSK
ncbi:pneumococcal serine-rich repeat protein isoform X2 [Pseudorasbora parva]|uniref:pneumococcal serine-rich repeat protein isoform X2 n=1 Tax=Pseudorasbora parva TaxID=51549 RepID=UPI00351F3A6D